jgi:hypothetical protein
LWLQPFDQLAGFITGYVSEGVVLWRQSFDCISTVAGFIEVNCFWPHNANNTGGRNARKQVQTQQYDNILAGFATQIEVVDLRWDTANEPPCFTGFFN